MDGTHPNHKQGHSEGHCKKRTANAPSAIFSETEYINKMQSRRHGDVEAVAENQCPLSFDSPVAK